MLRGFAMFGVLWSNLNEHYAPLRPATPLQHALAWAQTNLLELRFYSLLGFLFGIGFALQIRRARWSVDDRHRDSFTPSELEKHEDLGTPVMDRREGGHAELEF